MDGSSLIDEAYRKLPIKRLGRLFESRNFGWVLIRTWVVVKKRTNRHLNMKRLCFFSTHAKYILGAYSDLCIYSDLGTREKYFPKLGAYLSRGTHLSPGCFIGNIRYKLLQVSSS